MRTARLLAGVTIDVAAGSWTRPPNPGAPLRPSGETPKVTDCIFPTNALVKPAAMLATRPVFGSMNSTTKAHLPFAYLSLAVTSIGCFAQPNSLVRQQVTTRHLPPLLPNRPSTSRVDRLTCEVVLRPRPHLRAA